MFSEQHSDIKIKETKLVVLICYTCIRNVIEFTAYKHLTKIVLFNSTRGDLMCSSVSIR